jgi:DNA adenine methylase
MSSGLVPLASLKSQPTDKQLSVDPAEQTIDRDAMLARAALPLSATPRPFLRWAGSKRALLPSIVETMPIRFATYREPFLGGGSLFFLLQPRSAVLSDSCADLIETFRAVRDNASAVLRYLAPLDLSRETFYSVRADRSSGRFKRAAEFIYLNKACWNGLYRVNARGEFNVPYGAPKTANVIDHANLLACAGALASVSLIECADFEATLADARPGDLVFLDPPYVTKHNNNGFVDYNQRLFSWEDQERLAREARRLADIGAHVIVTNAMHDDVLDLYDGFARRTVRRTSTLASAKHARGRVEEALFWYVP